MKPKRLWQDTTYLKSQAEDFGNVQEGNGEVACEGVEGALGFRTAGPKSALGSPAMTLMRGKPAACRVGLASSSQKQRRRT